MGENRTFKQGDFIKRDNKKGSFMIYEGNDKSETSVKKLTLIASYDPEKYMMTAIGYDNVPHLDVATSTRRCADTVDTEKEDYWISLCTPTEKQDALAVLAYYNYYWDEEKLEMIDLQTGEIIKKIVVPDNTYYGEIIKPITDKFKNMLKQFCINKNRSVSPYYSQRYDRDWDEYGD